MKLTKSELSVIKTIIYNIASQSIIDNISTSDLGKLARYRTYQTLVNSNMNILESLIKEAGSTSQEKDSIDEEESIITKPLKLE